MQVIEVSSDEQIRDCFRAITELRPHLDAEGYFQQVKRQMQNHGYRQVAVYEDNLVQAVAGYRIAEFLAWGKALYLDDLITHSTARKRGYAGTLMDWLLAKAKEEGCDQFHLDSGTQRFDAHRLYLNKKLNIYSFHFARAVDGA